MDRAGRPDTTAHSPASPASRELPRPETLSDDEPREDDVEQHAEDARVFLYSLHAPTIGTPSAEPSDAGCEMEHYSE